MSLCIPVIRREPQLCLFMLGAILSRGRYAASFGKHD
jgi:hypothetical protein